MPEAKKLKMAMLKDNFITAAAGLWDKHQKEIQEAYDNGEKNVAVGMKCTIKQNDKGRIEEKVEITFVKTKIKDDAVMEYDPDQILFDFMDGS